MRSLLSWLSYDIRDFKYMHSEGQSNELKYTGRMFSLMNTTEQKITLVLIFVIIILIISATMKPKLSLSDCELDISNTDSMMSLSLGTKNQSNEILRYSSLIRNRTLTSSFNKGKIIHPNHEFASIKI